jgi:predicted Ser/Thr protein kinase
MPQKIGRYEITGELGKGAMGVVYKAVDPNIGREVALKTMRVDVHGEEHDDMLARFQNEARAAGALNHSNIVTIYDAGEDAGVFYIAMEYVAGRTLSNLLASERVLAAEKLINIGTQICTGLDYAHTKKVIHRDIKPSNIMIGPDGTVKIMDFGIAKAGASLTHTGEVLGTPNYMSPEQVRGKDLDGRTDLFSTGVILYEMATGERPFNGQNVTTIIYKIIHENVVPPRELDVTVHPGLSAIICKCLAKDREDRYQTGGDLAMALKSYKIVSLPATQAIAPPVFNPPTQAVTQPLRTPMPAPRTNLGAPATAAGAKMARAAEPATKVLPPNAAQGPRRKLGVAAAVLIAVLLAGVAVWKFRSPPHATVVQPQLSAPEQVTPPVDTAAATPEAASGTTADIPDQSATPTKDNSKKVVAPEGIGSLRVTSNPAGAQVTIDGVAQDWYVTPFNTPPMKSGVHAVTAQIAGLGNQTKQVQVVAGEKLGVDFQLASDKAIYNITSAPAGAEISIDGVNAGKTTPAEFTITPGQHKILLKLEGFAPYEVITDAGAGQTMNVAPTLGARNSIVSAPSGGSGDGQSLGGLARLRDMPRSDKAAAWGLVQFRTRPKGVTVSIDGKTLQRVTPFKVPVPAGAHQLTLQKGGFQTVTQTIQVEAGKQIEVEDRLLPQ